MEIGTILAVTKERRESVGKSMVMSGKIGGKQLLKREMK